VNSKQVVASPLTTNSTKQTRNIESAADTNKDQMQRNSGAANSSLARQAREKQNAQPQVAPGYQYRRALPPPKKEVQLTEQELKTFGNRCPKGYQKVRVLGKGGIAVVWLAQRDG